MLATIRHETFYKTGIWIHEALGIYVGWTAIKDSFSDGMPVKNATGDITLIFSGDEFTKSENSSHVQKQGAQSSYLVSMYEQDPNFLRALNGMFHGLLVDQSTATLFNDRYGMHPVYCHESNDALYFAAEAKAILAVRPELRTADPRSLGEFTAFSCVLGNRTIFDRISVLPAASKWVIRNGTIESKSTYFDPKEWEGQSPLDPATYYQELESTLLRSLPRYFAGPQPMGIAITGGLDTRVIMACHPSPPHTLPSYTFGSMFRESQDVAIGRRVARECDQEYQVIEVGDEFLSNFSRYAERGIYLTEGGVDVYRSSDLYVSEKARQIAPAKIVGTYGSEIIRHAVMFKPSRPMPGLFQRDFLPYVAQASETYAGYRREHAVTFAAFRQSPWYHHGVLTLEKSQLTVRSPYLDNDFVRTVYRAPRPTSHEDIRLRLIQNANPALARIPSDRGLGGNTGLIPALSHAYQEFTFKSEYAYDYGMPQWISRIDHSLSPLKLQRLFLGRHKFLHYRVWYRDQLSKYVREMLLDPLTLSRPYIDRKGLETIVEGHLNQGRNYTTEIHKVLTLELLHRLFFDGK